MTQIAATKLGPYKVNSGTAEDGSSFYWLSAEDDEMNCVFDPAFNLPWIFSSEEEALTVLTTLMQSPENQQKQNGEKNEQ